MADHFGPSAADRLPGPDVPVFVISVAAELTGLHPQTLRGYDRMGLVSPGRTGGGGRRYSWRDIERLREISRLSTLGIGLEGVRRILELETDVDTLLARVAELEAELNHARAEAVTRRYLPEPVRDAPSAVVLWRAHGR
jgi:MerR family transcriptional regulator/heat shock protein HspR